MNTNAYSTEIRSLYFARTYDLLLEGQLDAAENKYLFDQLRSFWPDGPFKNFDLSFGEVDDASEVGESKHLGSIKIKRKAPQPFDVCYQPSDDEFLEGLPGHAYWISLAVYFNKPDVPPRYLKCFWMSAFGPLEIKEVMGEVASTFDF